MFPCCCNINYNIEDIPHLKRCSTLSGPKWRNVRENHLHSVSTYIRLKNLCYRTAFSSYATLLAFIRFPFSFKSRFIHFINLASSFRSELRKYVFGKVLSQNPSPLSLFLWNIKVKVFCDGWVGGFFGEVVFLFVRFSFENIKQGRGRKAVVLNFLPFTHFSLVLIAMNWMCFTTSHVFLINCPTLGYSLSTFLLYQDFNFQLSIWCWTWKLKYIYGCGLLWIKRRL